MRRMIGVVIAGTLFSLLATVLLLVPSDDALAQRARVTIGVDDTDDVGVAVGELFFATFTINSVDAAGEFYKLGATLSDTTTDFEIGFPIPAEAKLIRVIRGAATSGATLDDTLEVWADQTLEFKSDEIVANKYDSTLATAAVVAAGAVISVSSLDGPGASTLEPDNPVATLIFRFTGN